VKWTVRKLHKVSEKSASTLGFWAPDVVSKESFSFREEQSEMFSLCGLRIAYDFPGPRNLKPDGNKTWTIGPLSIPMTGRPRY